MKKTILSILGFGLLASNLLAGGWVQLGNNPATEVRNSLTHEKVAKGNAFQVALYAAVDGTTDESLFVSVGEPTGIAPVAGLFTGGTRLAPMVPGGAYGMFQVRIWEAS